MELTDKQKEMVAEFLRKQDEAMDHLPSGKRVQILTQLKQCVRKELLKVGKKVLSDGRVESVLERIHITIPKASEPPATDPEPMKEVEKVFKPEPAKSADAPTPTAQTFDNGRHWMGVCVVLSDQFNKPVETIRWAFILLGCITGPISFLIYLGALYYTRKKDPSLYPEYDPISVWAKVSRVLVIAIGLYIVAFILLYGTTFLYLTLVGEPVALGAWSSVSAKHPSILTMLLFLLSSTAALSAMPLAHHWDKTLSTITNTGLAIYAVILSLGVSLTITGYLVKGAQVVLGN